MGKRRRTRVFLFGALALLAALVPAGLAVGSHEGDSTFGDPSVVLLTLGSVDRVTWMSETQSITGRNNCSVTFGGSDLLDFVPTAGQLGFVRDGLGVKSSGDGTGEPCGRIEASDGEAISVSLGSDLDGYLMTAIDVDLELKFNASVDVIFKHDGVTVATVTGFTGTGGTDDGPDSGDGDNYRFFARPTAGDNAVTFDEVVFDPSSGAVGLEGGADGTENGTLASNNSSQFEVKQSFGQITCQETVTIDNSEFEEVVGVITMEALDLDTSSPGGWDASCTQLKNYSEDVTASSLLFAPVLENSLARYTMVLTVENQTIMTDGDGQTTSLVMEYNDGFGSGDRTLRPCNGQPEFSAAFFEQDDTGLLPADEFACYFGVSLEPTGEGVGTEIWEIYFEDDPNFSFR